MQHVFSTLNNMNLIYKKMFDSWDIMDRKPNLILLETMSYDLKCFRMPNIFRRVIRNVIRKDANKLGYSCLGGMKALKKQILDYELALNPTIKINEASIFVGNGAQEVTYGVIKSILELPDNKRRKEIVIFSPNYSVFEGMIRTAGGKTIFAQGLRKNNFVPTINKIRIAITQNTCAIILVNPHNPTTVCYEKDYLISILALAKKHNMMVVSDEVYAEMVRPSQQFISIASLNSGFDNLVKVFGPSKDRPGMAGLKIGYCIGDKKLENSLSREYLVRNYSMNILAEYVFLVDLALRTAKLTGKTNLILSDFTKEEVEDYYKTVESNLNRIFNYQNRIVNLLKRSKKIIDYIPPQGCNMIFFRYYKDLSPDDFFNHILKLNVGVYTGDTFHIDHKVDGSWSRICVTQNWHKLSEGLKRLI